MPGQVRDVNSYSLSALVEQQGGIPRPYGISPTGLRCWKTVAARHWKNATWW